MNPSRWFRYRLRTLLGLTTLVAIGLGYYKAYVEPFQIQQRAAEKLVTSGALVGYQPAAPAWLRYLLGDGRFLNVVMVKLEQRPIKEAALAPLADLPHLERLYLAATPVTDDWLRRLPPLPRLKRISLWRTQVTNDGMAHLAGLTELEVLDVKNTRVTEAGLEHFRGHPNLIRLVHTLTLGDAGIDSLASMPRLQLDTLFCRNLGDDSLRKLAQRFSLESLVVENARATDAGIEQVAKRPSLVSLRVENVSLRGDCLAVMADHPALKQIVLHGTKIPFEQIARHFGGEATQLHMSANRLGLSGRRVVSWSGPIGPDDAEHLRFFPQLQSLQINYPSLAVGRIRSLPEMSELRILSLKVAVDDDGAELLGQIGHLQHLSLSGRQAMSPTGYRHLARLTDLESLTLRSCGLSDEQLVFVADLTGLQSLDIEGNSITNAGIDHLLNLSELRSLDISSCQHLDDEAFAKISRLERLEVISARNTQVTDAGLRHLSDMPHLRDVNVSSPNTTRGGIQALRGALIAPNARVH
ncbi:MAG: hypothetical protein KJ000_06990 [Pirellulaceae bacterium]|nr:hypothetical protein [Pirellulaceae bacterium]